MAESKNLGRRLVLTALLGALLALSIGVSTASATFIYKNGVTEKFGEDGTSASEIESSSMALMQSEHKLYSTIYSGNVIKISGFSLPGHTPIGGKFPIENEGAGSLGVDQTNGRIYLQTIYRGIFGWDSTGNPLNPVVFPIPPDKEDQCSATVDPKGNIWVADAGRGQVQEYNSVTGLIMRVVNVNAATSTPCKIAFDPTNEDMYVAGEQQFGPGGLYRLTAASGYHAVNTLLLAKENYPFGIAIDPNSHVVYVVGGYKERNKEGNTTPKVWVLTPSGGVLEEFQTGSEQNFQYESVALEDGTGNLYIGDGNPRKIDVFHPAIIPTALTTAPTSVHPTSFVANGTVDPAGGGPVTDCYLEWGTTLSYGEPTIPCSPSTSFSSAEDVSAEITGLEEGEVYHYRFVATNAEGKSLSPDRETKTAGKPAVEGVYANEILETSAQLNGEIIPEAQETTYWFEYGPTVQYGTKVPIPGKTLAASQEAQAVHETATGLTGGLYHYRLVAENASGTTFSEDHSFNFYPQTCPNAVVRQETGSEYLPDCRGYELVSPGNAGNVILTPENAQPGPLATNPSRFAFGGILGGVAGTEPLNSLNLDTYVATRTSTGWKTALVGLRGNEALGATITVGDQSFDEFMDFYSGGGFEGVPQPRRNLPYIWGPDGTLLGRWPLTQPLIPSAETTSGAFQPSPDFSHLAFSSVNVAFTLNGLVEPPGSAYDYNAETGSTTLLSRLPGGEELDLAQPPKAAGTHQFIIFPGNVKCDACTTVSWEPARVHPGVSTEGSHILMGLTEGKWTEFSSETEPPKILYMRVNDAITYEVSDGRPVEYVGMTSDGKKVFFTSEEQLTNEDTDKSTDLYMWTEANGGEISLLSKGASGEGNEEECNADLQWTKKCNVKLIKGAYATDSPIAEEAGDIYFYSPEQLDGSRNGVRGQQNLYRYHDGSVSFVATLTNHETYCPAEGCSNGPLGRIQVSPNGEHVAFMTRNKLTPYENSKFEEMYTYDPSSGAIVCTSCNPTGKPPTGDIEGSLQGNFMTYDGRTFFYSPDALTPKDTNGIKDIYEYTEGRPQLISPGTSATVSQTSHFHERGSGFEGVSADGTDVYFSTYDTLVGQDENGQSLKFYDARSGGGFPYVPPAAPCEAADECHGEGSLPPNSAGIVSNVNLGEGSKVPSAKKKAKKQKKQKKQKAHAKRHRRHAGGNR